MAAPAFGTAGTYLTGGTRTTSSVPVPASVASGNTILALLYLEASASVTPPDGTWQELTPAPATTGTVTVLRAFIKRASGADAGTYAFTHASAFTEGVAIRCTGAGAAGLLFDVINSASRSSNATTTPAVTLATTGIDRLLIWAASSVGAGAWTPPSTYTERVDTGAEISVATVSQASAGSSGSVTGTGPSGFMNAWLVAITEAILAATSTQTTTISTTAAGRAVGTASVTTTIAVTATAVLPAAASTQTTTIAVTAAARALGVAPTQTTTIAVTAAARLAGIATSTTTIATTAAARLSGSATSVTTIAVTAAGRGLGTASVVTTVRVIARARDANLPLPVGPLAAMPAEATVEARWSAGAQPTAAAGWQAGAAT